VEKRWLENQGERAEAEQERTSAAQQLMAQVVICGDGVYANCFIHPFLV
jgi:hypothetical protein